MAAQRPWPAATNGRSLATLIRHADTRDQQQRRGDRSASRDLVDEAVTSFRAANLDAPPKQRDLVADPIPHLTAATLEGVRETPDERRIRSLSDALVAELRAADITVMGAPISNLSIPSALEVGIDHVVKAGETFRSTDTGAEASAEVRNIRTRRPCSMLASARGKI